MLKLWKLFEYCLSNLLIIGDLIHGESIQFKYPDICVTYDQNEKESIETIEKIF